MASIRGRRPGVWEVRAFTGHDDRGRPTQVSRTVHGTKKDAKRLAAQLKDDPIARSSVASLSVFDIDRWVSRMRRAGVGESAIITATAPCGPPSSKLSAESSSTNSTARLTRIFQEQAAQDHTDPQVWRPDMWALPLCLATLGFPALSGTGRIG